MLVSACVHASLHVSTHVLTVRHGVSCLFDSIMRKALLVLVLVLLHALDVYADLQRDPYKVRT